VFHHVKFWRLWICLHLQHILSLICGYLSAQGQYWTHLRLIRRHYIKNRNDSFMEIITWAQETFPEITVCEHNSPWNPQMLFKALSCTDEAPKNTGIMFYIKAALLWSHNQLIQQPHPSYHFMHQYRSMKSIFFKVPAEFNYQRQHWFQWLWASIISTELCI